MGKRSGRPGPDSKLTPEVHREIVKHLEAGVFKETAADLVGISGTTLHHWLNQGKIAVSGPFREFYLDVKRAQATPEANATGALVSAGAIDWRAAEAYLKRAFPERWGDRAAITLEVQRTVQALLEEVEPHMSREAYAELIHAIARVNGVAGVPSQEDEPGHTEH